MQETRFYRLQIYVKKKTFSRLSQKMFSKVDCGVVCPAVSRLLCKVAVIHTQKPAAGVGVCGVCWGYLCGGGALVFFVYCLTLFIILVLIYLNEKWHFKHHRDLLRINFKYYNQLFRKSSYFP